MIRLETGEHRNDDRRRAEDDRREVFLSVFGEKRGTKRATRMRGATSGERRGV